MLSHFSPVCTVPFHDVTNTGEASIAASLHSHRFQPPETARHYTKPTILIPGIMGKGGNMKNDSKSGVSTVGLMKWVDWESPMLQLLPDPTRLFSLFVIGFPIVRFLMDHDYDFSLVVSGFLLDPFVLGCLAVAVSTSYLAASKNKVPLPLYDRWAAEWYWWNAFLYHGVLDGATGSFCQVPVMLSQYQVLDRRFITHHSVPFTVGCVEFFVMQPLCLALVWAIHRRAAYRFPLELVLGCCHIFGLVMFLVAEVYEGQLNVPSLDPVGVPGDRWANAKLNFYHFMYYWFGFWFCNLVWLFIPLIRMHRAFQECLQSLAITKVQKSD